MSKGWILCKPRFQDSYETNRLVEEFKNQGIGVDIINPNLIQRTLINSIQKYKKLK